MNDQGTLQLPPQASTVAADVDALYYFIFWGCTAFFVLIVALATWFVVRYRRREETEVHKPSASHNTPLELTWTIVPFLLLLVVFVWGFRGYMTLHVTPANALEYYVTGKQWLWQINHPTGAVEVNEMYVPVNKPVKVILSSEDVIHSFFVPSFRVKMDAYPNQYTTLWFEANRTGDFDLYCTEYCGNEHSGMIGKVHVLTDAEFQAWADSTSGPGEDTPLDVWGAQLYQKKACVTCHSIDGSKMTGPTFKGLWGRAEQMADGSSLTADENYIRESILEPQAKIVAGYDPVMPTYTGILKPIDIDALIAYIKTLE